MTSQNATDPDRPPAQAQRQAQDLVAEWRTTFDPDVVRAWAADAQQALKDLLAIDPAVTTGQRPALDPSDPADLRAVAEFLRVRNMRAFRGTDLPTHPNSLLDAADRIERDQAEAPERERLIDQADGMLSAATGFNAADRQEAAEAFVDAGWRPQEKAE